MDAQMKSAVFMPSDSISVLFFLQNIKTACKSNGIHETATMCLFPHFMNGPANAVLLHHLSAIVNNETHKEGTLTTCCQVVTFSLKNFATDDVTADAEADIMSYKRHGNMIAKGYLEKTWEKALRYGRVYDKSGIKGIIIGRLYHPIGFPMRIHRGAYNGATLQKLESYAISINSLFKLQEGSNSGSKNLLS